MNIVGRMYTRDQFVELVKTFDFGSIHPSFLVLHHTWSPKVDEWRGQRSIDGLKAYYEGKGWYAGPHFFVGPDGIWLFTPMSEVGVASNAANANIEFQRSWDVKDLKWYSLALEMVGDYDDAVPAGKVWENVKAVIGSLAMRLGWDVDKDIHFHREYNTGKSCPGKAVTYPWVRSEVREWMQAKQPIVVEPFIVDSPIGTNVHQGPGLGFAVAGSMADDAPFTGKLVPGDAFEGSSEWVWVSSGLGFVPRSRARKPQEPKRQLKVVGPPSVGVAKFTEVLAGSPALPFAGKLYDTFVAAGVDPAVALAFFYHESACGTVGICRDYDTKNWGNVRGPEDFNLGHIVSTRGGNFAKYATWLLGAEDWCKRLRGPKYEGSGLVTVDQVLQKYAPSSDSNNPTGYAATVKGLVAKWRQ